MSVRNGFAQEVRRYQPPGMLITDDMTKLLDTVARFIESGGTLTLEAKPEPPIGIDKLAYLRRPGPDLVSMLGLRRRCRSRNSSPFIWRGGASAFHLPALSATEGS